MLAPNSNAFNTKSFPLKFSPFIAKNTLFLAIFLVSIHNLLKVFSVPCTITSPFTAFNISSKVICIIITLLS